MNPLEIRVIQGLEDDNLLDHLRTMDNRPFFNMSPREKETYYIIWARLDCITKIGRAHV